MKERIKNMLISPDVEIRKLGLAYLNDNKTSSYLGFRCTKDDTYQIVPITQPLTYYNFKTLYDVLNSNQESFTHMLHLIVPYINYCYEGKD